MSVILFLAAFNVILDMSAGQGYQRILYQSKIQSQYFNTFMDDVNLMTGSTQGSKIPLQSPVVALTYTRWFKEDHKVGPKHW